MFYSKVSVAITCYRFFTSLWINYGLLRPSYHDRFFFFFFAPVTRMTYGPYNFYPRDYMIFFSPVTTLTRGYIPTLWHQHMTFWPSERFSGFPRELWDTPANKWCMAFLQLWIWLCVFLVLSFIYYCIMPVSHGTPSESSKVMCIQHWFQVLPCMKWNLPEIFSSLLLNNVIENVVRQSEINRLFSECVILDGFWTHSCQILIGGSRYVKLRFEKFTQSSIKLG